jgi:hypothetical protein
MTREAYDMATIALDKSLKLKALKQKIEREVPELGFDPQLKDIQQQIFDALDYEIRRHEQQFEDL